MMNELQLIRGIPIEVEFCKVHHITADEVVKLGEQTYYSYLNIFTISKDDLNKKDIPPEIYVEFLKMDEYQFLLELFMGNAQIRETIVSSLSLFLKESVEFDFEKGLVIKRIDGDFIITKDIFNRIKDVIFKLNFINMEPKKDDEYNPYDDKARELIEKRNKFKKLLEEKSSQDNVTLSDIVSVVASNAPNYNFDNVWKLTIYQLYTIYTRMGMKDQYETQIYLLPHSSEDKSSELKHWMSKIK